MCNREDYLATVQAAIQSQHQCVATRRETVFISEFVENKNIWSGKVEMFELTGHKTAKTCYAWTHFLPNGQTKIIAVLGSSVIDSARKAVQAAIFVDTQPLVMRDAENLQRRIQEGRKFLRGAKIKGEDVDALINVARQINGITQPRRTGKTVRHNYFQGARKSAPFSST